MIAMMTLIPKMMASTPHLLLLLLSLLASRLVDPLAASPLLSQQERTRLQPTLSWKRALTIRNTLLTISQLPPQLPLLVMIPTMILKILIPMEKAAKTAIIIITLLPIMVTHLLSQLEETTLNPLESLRTRLRLLLTALSKRLPFKVKTTTMMTMIPMMTPILKTTASTLLPLLLLNQSSPLLELANLLLALENPPQALESPRIQLLLLPLLPTSKPKEEATTVKVNKVTDLARDKAKDTLVDKEEVDKDKVREMNLIKS